MLSMFFCCHNFEFTSYKPPIQNQRFHFEPPPPLLFSQKPKGPYGDRKVDPEEEVPGEEEEEEAGNFIKSSSWKLFLASPTVGIWCIYIYIYTLNHPNVGK